MQNRVKAIGISLLAMCLIGGVQAYTKHKATMESKIENALFTNGPSNELAEEDRLYDWLIGSWTARVVDHFEDGAKTETTGEWHFAWVLEGRAIQDVWISPARPERSTDASKVRNRYGTTIRAFHPTEKKWIITWINPVGGAHNVLTARREGADIVQEGRDENGNIMRWVFSDIEQDSARWYGERSYDNGESWKLEAEFFLTRSQ